MQLAMGHDEEAMLALEEPGLLEGRHQLSAKTPERRLPGRAASQRRLRREHAADKVHFGRQLGAGHRQLHDREATRRDDESDRGRIRHEILDQRRVDR